MEEEKASWDEIRAYLREREKDEKSDWTDEERIAWARLPENYRKIHAAGLTPEEQERRVRQILGCETEEDKASFARQREDGAPADEEPAQGDEDSMDNLPPLDSHFRENGT